MFSSQRSAASRRRLAIRSRRPVTPRRHAPWSRQSGLRALLAGVILIGAVGSCELPKPKLPTIGLTPAGPSAVVGR